MNELVDTVVNRVMDMAGLVNGGYKWGEVASLDIKLLHRDTQRSITCPDFSGELHRG